MQVRGKFLSLLLAAILLSYYIRTLLPGIGYSGDAAKFSFAGYVLGTAHANGYPTYLIVNYAFTHLLGIGSIAYRANLLSAVFGAVACLFFFRLLLLLEIKQWIAFTVALGFGFTKTFWSQSIVAGVYTLNAVFVAATIYCFVRWHQSKTGLLTACAVYAFSFGNSLTVITLLPAIVYLTWSVDRALFTDPKRLLRIVAVILLGVLQYVYPFWRYYDPSTKYLEMVTPDLRSLWWAVTGAQFRSQLFMYSFGQVIRNRIPWALLSLLKEFYYLTPVAVLGGWRLRRELNLFFILAFIGNLAICLNFGLFHVQFYLLPCYLITAIYLALAIDLLFSKLQFAKQLAYAALFLWFPVMLLVLNLPQVDQHRNTAAADQTEAILRMAKKDAVLISPTYMVSECFWYYLIGEGLQDSNRIFLVHEYNLDAIVSYMRANKPIYLPNQRIFIQPGLTVYCIGPLHLQELKQNGFYSQEVTNSFYKIRR